VLLRELFLREAPAAEEVKKKVGRAFNHPEDLTFLNGSAGAIKALEHIKAIGKNAKGVRYKWDGAPQVYWGRDENGTFILTNHNGWLRGGTGTSTLDEFTTQQGIYNFILNKSGNPKTPEEQEQRKEFAREFSFLHPVFEKATPEDFRGFVYADGLFLGQPTPDADGIYNLHPNPKSGTVYHIAQDTDLGQQISTAHAMVVGHGIFETFGDADHTQQPKDSFEEFNSTSQLIVLGPYYTQMQPEVDSQAISIVEAEIKKHSAEIDQFLSPLPGVSGFKNIVYRYVNTMSKQGQLHNVGHNFMMWMESNPTIVSPTQLAKVQERAKMFPGALPAMFNLFDDIMQLKNSVIAQLDKDPGEIKVTNPEGWVHYDKKGDDHIKLVPRSSIETPSGTIPAWTP